MRVMSEGQADGYVERLKRARDTHDGAMATQIIREIEGHGDPVLSQTVMHRLVADGYSNFFIGKAEVAS